MKKMPYIFIMSFLLSLFSACTLFVRPPFEPELEELSSAEVYFHDWEDDLFYEGLETAVGQSIRYFKKISPERMFQYGDLNYSPEEMIASMELFMEIIKNSGESERITLIKEKFHFFESKNSDGKAFFTGYYEPMLEGSITPTEELSEPLYETPEDLIKVNLGSFSEKFNGESIVGRLEGNQLVPYDSREEIVYEGTLKGRASPIAYVNEIELFFLQIQGSGLIRFSNGNVKRINYAQKNGHPYRSIGQFLTEEIPKEEMSLQSIKSYLYSTPERVREVFSYNQSYTFFREVDAGPLGNIEVPLTPNRSAAMDSRMIPKGGLAFIETELPVVENGNITEWKSAGRFVLIQDTGGAIREHGRVDLFLGHGEAAGISAGHIRHAGRSFLVVARKEFLQ
ncbi:MAG: MltA domain-containing protein [Nitrospirota bacterium]